MDLFEKFDNSENGRISGLLEKSAKYCKYGQSYFRNIADPANRLKKAISDGHTGKLLDYLADDLEHRLNYWQEKLNR